MSYVEEVEDLNKKSVKARRAIEGGYEIVESPTPALLTVVEANDPRPANAKKIMQYKKAMTRTESLKFHADADYTDAEMLAEEEEVLKAKGLWIAELSAEDVKADVERIGLKGSPTKVKKIESVVLTGTDFKNIEPTENGINKLMHELIEDHTLG